MKISNHLFYKKAYLKHKNSAKGLHWHSQKTQEKRFEVIINFIFDELKNSTLIDAGCGYGHLIDYFKKIDIFPKDYLGVDCEKFMIDICRKNYSQFHFLQLDILNDSLIQADFYICSGALNLLNREELFKFINKCFLFSNKGFIFNHISNNFNKITKEEIIKYCKTLSDYNLINENYIKNDYTIYQKK